MEFDETKKCSRVKFNIGPIRIDLNPVVTVASAIIIWGFVIWCIIQPKPANQEMSTWMLWVTKTWTWLYIGTQDAWAVFIIVVYFSKYSNIKLGKPDDKPEYGDATYFTMLFAAGIGMGLFYYGVAEPIYHYEPGRHGNRHWGRYVSTFISVLVFRKSFVPLKLSTPPPNDVFPKRSPRLNASGRDPYTFLRFRRDSICNIFVASVNFTIEHS